MSNLVCIKHKDYDGTKSPRLECRACCSVFIATIKSKEEVNVTDWLKSKQKEYEERWEK